jgi:hypothetical protein
MEPNRADGPDPAPAAARAEWPSWLNALQEQWRSNSLFLTSVVVASLAWGVSIGVLSTVLHPAAPIPTPVPAALLTSDALTGELSAKLHDRDRDLAAVMLQNENLVAALKTVRHEASLQAAAATRAASALRVQQSALDAQSQTVDSLRAQIAELKSDNVGLERNYTDLLDALHRTQDEAYVDEKRLAAAFAAERAANERIAQSRASGTRVHHTR